MPTTEYAVFDTAIGRCAIAWNAKGIAGVQLPERAPAARLLRRHPDAQEAEPPPSVQHAIDDIVALIEGEPRDLSDVVLDLQDVSEFQRKVYAVARSIAPGATLSYGDIAARLGDRAAAREVGEAMGRNPFPIIVPCHRVVGSGGKLGGFSAPGGVATKLRLLAIEGAQVGPAPTLFDSLPVAVRRR